MKTKSNVIFDLDGTLTDSGTGIKNSVRFVLTHYGFPMETEEQLNRYVGPPLLTSFGTYLGMTRQQAEEAISVYREYFTTKGMFENAVYEGVIPLLDTLKAQGKRLFIATGKPTVYTLQILEHFGLSHYFDRVCGIGLDESDMGKAELISQVMKSENLTPDTCLMVGDREFDILGAKEVGIPAVGVTYGYGTLQELTDARADKIACSVAELQEILCGEMAV